MDDVQIPVLNPSENVNELIRETEQGLEKGGFPIKSWTRTGQEGPPRKYLCYDYFPATDQIKLRIKFNMSKKKRGVRVEPDIENYDAFEDIVRKRGLSKRNVASLLAGVVFDPLGLASPYLANLKIAYRRVCHTVDKWDNMIYAAEEEIVSKTVKQLFLLNAVLMPRSAFIHGAKSYKLRFFFDASDYINNTSVVIENMFPDKCVN